MFDYEARTPEQLNEAVQAGIKLLNEKMPDWFNRVDISRLDINDPYSCVIGQLFYPKYGNCSPFTSGLLDLGFGLYIDSPVESANGSEYGFGFFCSEDNDMNRWNLNTLWKKEIMNLQEQSGTNQV